MQLLIISMAVAPMLALRPATAEAAGWSGWARCDLDIRGPGYENKETHTWFVSDAVGNSAATHGTGRWNVSGRGQLRTSDGTTSMRAEWDVNGTSISGGRFVAVIANGMVSIKPFHAQLRQQSGIVGYTQQTISGKPRSPTTWAATAYEWNFPIIRGPATSQTIVGFGPGTPAPGWGSMRVPGSTMTVSCNWSFANGSTPAPPPTVAVTAVPIPPRTASERPWTRTAECDALPNATPLLPPMVTRIGKFTGTLVGGQRTSSGGMYVHPVIWKVKGTVAVATGTHQPRFRQVGASRDRGGSEAQGLQRPEHPSGHGTCYTNANVRCQCELRLYLENRVAQSVSRQLI